MTAYLGRVVRAVLPTVSSSNAGGFWNPVMAQYYQQAGSWPSGSGADPYFDNTTLLLHGDGTNGAQNNTFLDSSANNFPMTRNGNTTQGSFNPYVGPGNWSAFFNNASGVQWRNNGRVTVNSTATFTMEAWIYLTATPVSTAPILADGQNNTSLVYWGFDVNITRNLQFFWYAGSAVTCASTGTISLNQWTHVAISVSAGAIKLFIDGALQTTTGTSTLTNPSGSTIYMQSGMRGSPANYFTGYISNLRLLNGTALYSTTFTPSTTPLVATTTTSLLAFQNNSLNDISGSNAGATSVFGAPLVSKFSPFTFYQTTPASYSGYFDGSGDYLSLSASTAFGVGTGDFTIEYWAFYNTFASSPIGFDTRSSSGDITPSDYTSTNGNPVFYYNSTNLLISTNAALLCRWNHIAWVRSGTTLTSYVNGVASGSVTSAANFGTSQPLRIAGNITAANFLNGSISNFRFTKGQALYTANFTPSTSPLTTTSQGATAANVSLLTCQSTTFIDNSPNAFTITANGNATPERANPFTDTVTGPTPYSAATYGGTAQFDGSGDYLSSPNSTAFKFGTGDFTVEWWWYLTSAFASGSGPGIGQKLNDSTGGWVIYRNTQTNTDKITVRLHGQGGSAVGGGDFSTTVSPTPYTWQHWALVRSGTTLTWYCNGAACGISTGVSVNITDTDTTGLMCVGLAQTWGYAIQASYISNLRVVKGTAVYTAPFVPPVAPVAAVTNTQLLLNGTNAGIFDNTAFADLETVGNTQISTSIVKYGTGSIYFDGSGDWLIVNSPNGANDYAFGSGDFTLEMWIYPTAITSRMLYDSRPNSSVGVYPTLYINSSSSITYYTNGSDRISGASAVINTWQHIALVRSSGTTKLYINGTQSGSTYTDANTYLNGASRPIIGVDGGNTSLQNYAGYIDDLRITKGVARYTANFTPPAGPFPNF